MKVTILNDGEYREFMWLQVSLSAVDFRNTFPGDLVNLATLVNPESTPERTQALLELRAREIATWGIAHRERFSPGDRFQIILGWPKSIRDSGRQIVKIGGDFEAVARISDGTTAVVPRNGWTNGIFLETDTEQEAPALPPASGSST